MPICFPTATCTQGGGYSDINTAVADAIEQVEIETRRDAEFEVASEERLSEQQISEKMGQARADGYVKKLHRQRLSARPK